MDDTGVTIDKVSAMLHGGEAAREAWYGLDYKHEQGISPRVSSRMTHWGVHVTLTAQDWDVEGATGPDAYWMPESLRVEFNPNNPYACEEAYELGQSVGLQHVTRLDVAVDYPGVDLRRCTFSRARVKGSSMVGQDGKVETVYLGRRSSAVMFRCYDKAREQGRGELGEWMRVECQRRYRPGEGHKLLADDMFDGLTVGPADAAVLADGLSLHDRGMLALAEHYPSALSGADSRTKQRVRDLQAAASSAQGLRIPADAYRAARAELKAALQGIGYWR